MKPIKPFIEGQKITCKKSTWTYPHDMKKPLIVDNCQWFPLSYRLKRDIERNYYGHWRVFAHIDGKPEFHIDARSELFIAI